MSGFTEIWRRVTGFARHEGGQVALIFALGLPALSMVVAGAIDLSRVAGSQDRLQSIADAAALAAAPALSLAADGAAARGRAEAFVEGQLSQWADAPTVVETYEIVTQGEQRGIRVLLQANRQSFFVNLLPPGGWNFVADATAVPVGRTPLCVLSIGTGTGDLNTLGSSRLMAPDCGIHSNGNISGDSGARIEGRRIQAVGTASGPTMTPAPGESAANIADPFASMSFPSLNGCPFSGNGQSNPIIYNDGGTHYLAPAIHCRPIQISAHTTVVLNPGDHFFRKNLDLRGIGRLQGEDVFLFFDHGSDPLFDGNGTRVNLIGRKSGPYAGMVMATVAGNQPSITLPGSNVERLLGVVYVRHANGFLEVNGTGVAAEDSAWTVIVARRFISTGTARIRINANYESSDVPVPIGVGPNAGGMGGNGTRLVY
jgi:hypothetical protein